MPTPPETTVPDVADTMRAAAIERFGGPGELSVHSLPLPQLDAGQVLIRVHTAGVGVWDPTEREGKMVEMLDHEPRFPYVLGSDGSGTVVATADDVDRFDKGDEVYAAGFLNPKGGFYAEYAAVDAETVAPLPGKMPLDQAGALAVDGVTALRGLRDVLRLRKGQDLMIFGASGGVGHLAVQLAKRMGARVLAVASGQDGVRMVSELGADAGVDGKDGDVAEAVRRFASDNHLDAALVAAHGEGLEAALPMVREGGRIAWPNGVNPVPEPPEGVGGEAYDGAADREILGVLNDWIGVEPFRVHVARKYPLEEAAEAHRALDRHFLGKLALAVAR